MARSLPLINVEVNGHTATALVDTGCMTTLVDASIVKECNGVSYVTAFNNVSVKCRGWCKVKLLVRGTEVVVEAIVTEHLVAGIQVVLGMDIINQLGGVSIMGGVVRFGQKSVECCNAVVGNAKRDVVGASSDTTLHVEDKDFDAKFDGKEWIIRWKWKSTEQPVLKNKISCYNKGLVGDKKQGFEDEVERWIAEGILVPWNDQVETGVIPLMAIEQETKNKIRPVLDFRELNQYVNCHTGDDVADVCTETLRTWRQTAGAASIVDLKSAYLQLRVSPELWKYQLVNYKGRTYCLTRLGFGLNSAPRIMAKVLKTVLNQSQKIASATTSYIDDILVDEGKVTATEVRTYLKSYGLVTKEPELLDGGAALGLKLKSNEHGELVFTRGNQVPEYVSNMSRRELFSVCGKLVGHYPVAGWLRVACSYIKRVAEGFSWEDYIGDEAAGIIQEILSRVQREDPVTGKWSVPKTKKGVVWCDASSLALGVVLCIDEQVVEDGAWLRKRDDYNHINVAELEAAMRALNMAVKWGFSDIEITTDSSTVAGWLKNMLSAERRIQTRGASEMVIKRRLGTFKNVVEEFGLNVTITLVPTTKNRADVLTRVRKSWLNSRQESSDETVNVTAIASDDLRTMHNMHHMGVDRTLFLAKKIAPEVNRNDVKKIVQSCQQCQSIDPAPRVHERGKLSVTGSWQRIAIDVTHYHQVSYLSIVDCGPGRFAIWRELRNESAEFVARVINEVFLERGAAVEVLMDNATVFHSQVFMDLLDRWKVSALFRAAYRPCGNGIVERHHRTVKALAEKAGITPMEAVFWYNVTPRCGVDPGSVPQLSVNNYGWRGPHSSPLADDVEKSGLVKIGDEVWVKPPNVRCTTTWKKGIVTAVNSKNNISVDGTPRHILDIRRVIEPEDTDDIDSESEELEGDREEVVGDTERRYPQRVRRIPIRFNDYYPEREAPERGRVVPAPEMRTHRAGSL